MDKTLWGIDLGGTKIEGVVIDNSDTISIHCRIRIPTEADQGYLHILNQIGLLVEMMRKECGQTPDLIGFGTPGVLDPCSGLLKNSNTTCLNGQALKKDLEESLSLKTVFANDANCFALAENRWGAASGAGSCFGVIMGTGVGGGIVINGRVHGGLQGIAGEWGHNVIEEQGPECYCGKSGCVEAVISGTALQRHYAELSGQQLALNEIIQRAEEGNDENALRTRERLHTLFGKALVVVINILDPEVIVLGGGLSNISSLYNQGVAEIARHVFNNRLETRIVKNELGDSAGVFGAALLCAA